MTSKPDKKVAVIVPIYKETMSKSEELCLKRNTEILSKHDIYLVAPENLNINNYHIYGNYKTEYFKSDYFKGIKGYNNFMLSKEFYERFSNYEYILICQLDVFVFSDQLLEWCNKDIDYVGAPWINQPFEVLKYIGVKVSPFKALKLLFTRKISSAVGNGGFSLRKTSTFIQSLNENNSAAAKWPANEDFYWSFFATVNNQPLRTPTVAAASAFCIELKPKKLLQQNNFQLPFAIHAWQRYDANVWKPYLKELGYEF